MTTAFIPGSLLRTAEPGPEARFWLTPRGEYRAASDEEKRARRAAAMGVVDRLALRKSFSEASAMLMWNEPFYAFYVDGCMASYDIDHCNGFPKRSLVSEHRIALLLDHMVHLCTSPIGDRSPLP